MSTSYKLLVKTITVLFLSILSTNLEAQENDIGSNDLKTSKVIETPTAFKEWIKKIAFSKRYSYRDSLRKARITSRVFAYQGNTFSEIALLKTFKKAGRKSATLEAFIAYFSIRELPFLVDLDHHLLSGVYLSMRKSTFNGYLELVGTTFMSLYTIDH